LCPDLKDCSVVYTPTLSSWRFVGVCGLYTGWSASSVAGGDGINNGRQYIVCVFDERVVATISFESSFESLDAKRQISTLNKSREIGG
jgi:hypothetical protein